MVIWGRSFGDVADVPLVSPTFQSRWETLRSIQFLRMSPMHRRHVPVDTGASPSLTTIWGTRLYKTDMVFSAVYGLPHFSGYTTIHFTSKDACYVSVKPKLNP